MTEEKVESPTYEQLKQHPDYSEGMSARKLVAITVALMFCAGVLVFWAFQTL